MKLGCTVHLPTSRIGSLIKKNWLVWAMRETYKYKSIYNIYKYIRYIYIIYIFIYAHIYIQGGINWVADDSLNQFCWFFCLNRRYSEQNNFSNGTVTEDDGLQ